MPITRRHESTQFEDPSTWNMDPEDEPGTAQRRAAMQRLRVSLRDLGSKLPRLIVGLVLLYLAYAVLRFEQQAGVLPDVVKHILPRL